MARFVLAVNGREHVIEGEADDRLLPVLRDELGLTGSKFGCGEGQCGACTVLVDGQATRSCVARLSAVTARPITTIEGLGTPERPHPVQQAFLDAEALQCGYCTPGMIMAVVSLLRPTPRPTEADIARVLDRNVCRCGTFPRIVRAIQDAATRLADAGRGARP
jgi:aerobic-type carbon monoxide dehydrogenase small subunit (CoxS/CutS family)